MSSQSDSDRSRESSTSTFGRWFVRGTPGLVFLLASIGPHDLVSGSIAGASYGTALLWTLLVIAAARYVILEATARYVVAADQPLMAGFKSLGRWPAWIILGAITIKRHIINMYQMLILGLAIGWLLGTESTWVTNGAAVLACGIGFLVMYRGGYPAVERIGKPLALLLGLPLLMAALLARPDPLILLEGLTRPRLPSEEALYGPALAILMLVASGVGPLSSLKYPAYVRERSGGKPWSIRHHRRDLVRSLAGILLLSGLIQIAAAGVLHPAGLQLQSLEDLVPLYTHVFGLDGQILLSIGLWAAVFTTYVGSNLGYSLVSADIVTSPTDRWVRKEVDEADAAPGAPDRRVERDPDATSVLPAHGKPDKLVSSENELEVVDNSAFASAFVTWIHRLAPRKRGESSAATPDSGTHEQSYERRRQRNYRLFLVFFCLSPAYVFLTDWRPLPLIVLSLALEALALPTIAFMLLRITSDRRRMGAHVNSMLSKLGLTLVVLVSLYLAYVTGVEFVEGLFGTT